MNKKANENGKENDSKAKKAKGLHMSAATPEGKNRGAKPMKVTEDPRFAQAVQNYEAGLKALQIHKYDKAKAYFEKVLAGPSPELADRAHVHLNSCNQQMNRVSTTFKTPEEQFDYAVSLMNMGDYVTARENFDTLDAKVRQAGFHLVRHGGSELPDRPLPRSHQQSERGDSAEPGQSLPGAQRFRLQEPGRRPQIYRTALSRHQRGSAQPNRISGIISRRILWRITIMPGYSSSAEVRRHQVCRHGRRHGPVHAAARAEALRRLPAGEDASGDDLPSISDLSAIVTVSDDGGSSGRLRKELNLPAPGDIRNCIVALSEEEALLSRLFQYRFPAGEGVGGHSFGNLFLSAMNAITGDFSQAVEQSSAILATRGHIYPATTSNAQLYAIMDDGSVVRGETNITASDRRIVELRMAPANANLCRRRWRPSRVPTSSPLVRARSSPAWSPICWCAMFPRRSPTPER